MGGARDKPEGMPCPKGADGPRCSQLLPGKNEVKIIQLVLKIGNMGIQIFLYKVD